MEHKIGCILQVSGYREKDYKIHHPSPQKSAGPRDTEITEIQT